MNILLNNFDRQYRYEKVAVNRAIKRVMQSGRYILGKEVENLEKEFASFNNSKHAVAVASGTDALSLGLRSLGLTHNDGVVVPTNVYPTSFGVAHSGAKIQLCDVDPKTFNVSLNTLEKAIKKNTRAIVAVHLYGNPAPVDELRKFCDSKKLYLIEDCAQAHGAKISGKRVGSFGDVSCFSFYPTKNLGAYGDGGMIVTNNMSIAEKIKLLRMYGEKERYKSIIVGYNSRLDELQAAILREKLKDLNKLNLKRNKIAKYYRKKFASNISFQEVSKNATSVYHLFVLKTKKRDKLINYLNNKKIQAAVHYPVCIHQTKAFSYLGYKKGDFPVSEGLAKQLISIPVHPFLKQKEVQRVASEITAFYV